MSDDQCAMTPGALAGGRKGTHLVLADADRFGDVDGVACKPGNTPGLYIYHLLNRAGGSCCFKTMKFYAAVEYVNTATTKRESQRSSISTAHGQSFGDESWVARTVSELGLKHTTRPKGRSIQANIAEADTWY